MTIRIAMWSGPRNISTAMMRAWENREDCTVSDEPLYAAYLAATGLDHPGREVEERLALRGAHSRPPPTDSFRTSTVGIPWLTGTP